MTDNRDGERQMLDHNCLLEPGLIVRNPLRSDWGTGQIQSIIGTRITVNFENAGKLVLDGSVVALESEPLQAPDSLLSPSGGAPA